MSLDKAPSPPYSSNRIKMKNYTGKLVKFHNAHAYYKTNGITGFIIDHVHNDPINKIKIFWPIKFNDEEHIGTWIIFPETLKKWLTRPRDELQRDDSFWIEIIDDE